jgi:hypothetical protein
MTANDYKKTVSNIYKLIVSEFENLDSSDLASLYPRLVVMCEFMRLLRGESFMDFRDENNIHFDDAFQDKMYKMEDDLKARLKKLRRNIDFQDEKVQYYIDQMMKSFQAKDAGN